MTRGACPTHLKRQDAAFTELIKKKAAAIARGGLFPDQSLKWETRGINPRSAPSSGRG